MYEVLVYVYENYGGSADCADRQQLGRRLNTLGFGRDAIQQALSWLDGLDRTASGLPAAEREALPSTLAAPTSPPLRIYGAHEMERLGGDGIACLRFLEDAGALSPALREIVIDRALAASDEAPLALDDLKIIVMMVYWHAGINPGILVLDDLTDDTSARRPH